MMSESWDPSRIQLSSTWIGCVLNHAVRNANPKDDPRFSKGV